MIIAEFDDDISIDAAKVKIKDKVDNAKADTDWPNLDNGSKVEPNVFELNISEEVPILNINLQGNYTTQQLKKYGELLQDDIEEISEVKKVDILGVDDKEIEIAVDIFKMTAAQVNFDEIQNAVKYENMTLSGGNLVSQGSRNNIRIVGEIKDPKELENIIVKSYGGTVYLKDIAKVSFKEKEKTTYAREKGSEVVMLNVKKRSGQNMISAIDQVKERIEKAKETYLPKNLKIELTNDQSSRVEHQVDELSNHIIFGIILVMIVLMFTMGLRNSLFVGAAIPLSMMIAFAILSALGLTLNTMVLFGLVMGLGMLVDDGIVVVDNVFANMKKGYPRIQASKIGIGEIAWPVISSTATTLMAFLPFALWPGTMGKFMKYFPMTLTVTLTASLFVAMVINAAMTGDNIPNQAIVYIEYPQGTSIEKTNKATLFVENQVIGILQKYVDPKTDKNFLAESIVSQVGKGAGNPNVDAGSASETPFKGKVTVSFSEFKFRQGINTSAILEEIRSKVKGIAGAAITVEKDANGPPAGYPISIQLAGDDYDMMLTEADKMIAFVNSKNIPGIEKLSVDINKESPELEVKVDRVNAGRNFDL
eukprot:g32965.t1